jgi:photosystem II stability/assembly factor-like uncharacterized protein
MSVRPLQLLVSVCVISAVALAGCGSPKTAGTPAPTVTVTATISPSATPTPAPTSTGGASTPGLIVPSGFRAASVTFVSTDEAFVLGTAPGLGTLLLHTLHRDTAWTRLPAPSAPLGRPRTGPTAAVWGVRFASPSHGFIFGGRLYETTDGGRNWAVATAPVGRILSLAIVHDQALALVASGSGPGRLVRRPLSGGSWASVANITMPDLLDPTDLISSQAGTAAVLDGTSVLVTTNGGISVAAYPTPVSKNWTPGSVAATSKDTLALLMVGQGFTGHTEKLVYTSGDGGATWTKTGKPPTEGDGGTLAGGNSYNFLLATASAASWLDHSPKQGDAWTTVLTYGDGGVGWADLGFTTMANAVVVHGPVDEAGNGDGRPGRLLESSDGGMTWHMVGF